MSPIGGAEDPLDIRYQRTWLDAIALVSASHNRDNAAVQRILDDAEMGRVAMVLVRMLRTEVGSRRMDDFLAFQVEETLAAARMDASNEGDL